MFSVSSISSCLGLSRQQLLEGVVAGKKGPVHKVYFTPGHLFVTVQDGHILYTFDVLPTSLPQALSRLGSLDIPSTADAIVDMLYIKKKPSLVIIIFANGAVDVWQFNLDNKFTWIKVGDFELLEGHDPEVKVISVTLHDLHNTIYWCERHGTGEAASFNICKKTLPPESEPVNRSTVGATVTILEGSPNCRLLPGKDCLIVWPECPGPQGLFFKWFHQTSTLQSHILPNGCVHTDDRVTQPVQYKDSVYRLLGIWCQTRDLPQIEGHMIHPVTKATHLLYHDGSTWIVCEEEDMKAGCQLCTMEGVHGSHWLIYRCAVVAVNTKCLRFYSIQNGAILQEVDITEITCGSPLDVWNSMARIQSAGFWCNSGVYGIKMTKSSQWTKVSGGAVPLNLCGKQNLAAQMVVEEAHNYYKSKCVNPNTDLAKDLLLNMKVFQSPALVIALLQQGRENSSNPELSSVLKEIQKQYGSENSKLLHTKLNQLVGPLLQEYWRLEDKVQALMKDDKPALKHREQTLKDVIVGIVQGDSSLEARRSQLELLADSFPFDVLETLIEYLDLSTEDLSQEALRKWAPILASEEGSSGSTFPLFEILCRLLYTEKPEQLISFVKMSQAISDRISGTSAFMRRKEEHQFYERALECVGEPERSGKVESAAIAQASLVLNSGMQASQVQALHILLKYHLWVPSIKLVQQLADHSDLHLELFQLLLTAVLKAGVFATYCTSIMEAVPDRISMPEFLSLLQTHTKGGPLSMKEDHIFSSDEQDTKMGAIKPFLLKMIGDR